MKIELVLFLFSVTIWAQNSLSQTDRFLSERLSDFNSNFDPKSDLYCEGVEFSTPRLTSEECTFAASRRGECGTPTPEETRRIQEMIELVTDCNPIKDALKSARILVVDHLPSSSNPEIESYAKGDGPTNVIWLERENLRNTPDNNRAVNLLRHEAGHLIYYNRRYSNIGEGYRRSPGYDPYNDEDFAKSHGRCFRRRSLFHR